MKRIFFDGRNRLFVQEPSRRTIQYNNEHFFLALPRLFFFCDMHSLYPLVGDGIFRKRNGFIEAEFVTWNFYNTYNGGSVCFGNTIVDPEDMVDYFWSSSFNGTFCQPRPIFVEGKRIPIVGLRQWDRATRKDPRLQHKFDIPHYIATASNKITITIDYFEEKNKYYALNIERHFRDHRPKRITFREKFGALLADLFF